MIVKRERLHQIIEDLSEPQLLELAKFVEALLAQSGTEAAGFELWTETTAQPADLYAVIQAIKNTPPNAQAITLPTQNWADVAPEITQAGETSLDVVGWNQRWDALEAEMEAASLSHEEAERRDQDP